MSFAHITIATPDVDKSTEFFQKTLGWEPIDHPTNIVNKGAWLQIAPGQELHLNEIAKFSKPHTEDEFGRHVALFYPLDDFSGLKARLVESGAELIAPRRETPFERFFFRDPNGYLFEVMEAR